MTNIKQAAIGLFLAIAIGTANAQTTVLQTTTPNAKIKLSLLDYSKYLPNNKQIKASYYGERSEKTGRQKTVEVKPYRKKDGTYVQRHYRSPPKR
jgi:hypothetical protein